MSEEGYFHAWQCFSLVTSKRTVDFIVPKREDLLYLANGLKTVLHSVSSAAGDRQRA